MYQLLIDLGYLGGMLGVMWGANRIGRGKAPTLTQNPARALCGCDHDYSAHDPATGRCGAQIRREHYHAGGGRSGYEWVPCPCRTYTGPQPIDSVFIPPSGLT